MSREQIRDPKLKTLLGLAGGRRIFISPVGFETRLTRDEVRRASEDLERRIAGRGR